MYIISLLDIVFRLEIPPHYDVGEPLPQDITQNTELKGEY